MSTEENKAAERRLTQHVWSAHNPAAVRDFVANDVVEHNSVLGPGAGRDGYQRALQMLFTAFQQTGDGFGHRYLPLRRR
jgi:SnoaL-like polyketide cyclase